MKIVPSEDLKKHLLEQNIPTPDGGFDIPDAEYDAEKLLLAASHELESAEQFEERLQYRLIWKLFGVPANGSQKGVDLTAIQRIEAMRREVADVVEKHLPNVSGDISKVINLGHAEVVGAISGLKTFEGESHAEMLRVKTEFYESISTLAQRAWKFTAGALGAIVVLLILIAAFSISAHCQLDGLKVSQAGVKQGQFSAGYPNLNFTGTVTVSCVNLVCTVNVAGGSVTNNPGGSANQLQFNSAGTAFGGVSNGSANMALVSTGSATLPSFQFLPSTKLADFSTTAATVSGKIPIYDSTAPNAAGGTGAYVPGDPLVQGLFAHGSTSEANPVAIGGFDGTNTRRLSIDTSGRPNVNINGTVPVSGTFWQATQPVSGTFWQTTQPVSIATMPSTPVTGTFWQATQPVSGTFFQATQPVSNAGTFSVQCTSGCTAGGSFADSSAFTFATTAIGNMGAVVDDVATNTVAENSAGAVRMNTNRILYMDLSKTAANTNKLLVTPDSVALPANQSVNVSQINGVTPLMGNGVTGTGSQRVTIASDNTAFGVNATLSAETTKVIGTVNVAASQSITATQATGSNLHVVVDTAPSTAVTNAGTFAVQAVGTLGDNGGAATTNRVGTLPAIAQATPPAAATAGRDSALLTDLHRVAYTSQMPTDVASYVASKQGLVSAASATDIAVLSGNASNAVIVTKIMVSCTQTTAGIIDLILLKRSTADTAGTSTGSPTTVPLDSSNAAGSSSVLTYTANPTTGSLVGNVDTIKLGCMATGTTSPNDIYIWRPSMGQSIVLRGTAQQIAVNLNSATVTGGNFNITIQWIEATNY